MKHLFTLMLTFTVCSQSLAQECDPLPKDIGGLFEQCQTSFYKIAPHCSVGQGACLSLVLYGLVNHNLWEYREDLRRRYDTPLKRVEFSKTSEYKRAISDMKADYANLTKMRFCSKTQPRWIYDLNLKAFTFPYENPISNTSLSLYDCSEAQIKVGYRKALEIEDWDSEANSKYVFFKVSKERGEGGRVKIRYSDFVWTIGEVHFSSDGNVAVSYKEGCAVPNGSGQNSYRHRR